MFFYPRFFYRVASSGDRNPSCVCRLANGQFAYCDNQGTHAFIMEMPSMNMAEIRESYLHLFWVMIATRVDDWTPPAEITELVRV